MFPLFGESFGIDVVIPDHPCSYEHVVQRHSATPKYNVGEAAITCISLADVNAVADFRERPVVCCRTASGRVVPESHVCRARVLTRLQPNSEEPVVNQCSAQSQAEAVTLALTLLPIISPGDARGRTSYRRIIGRLAPALIV